LKQKRPIAHTDRFMGASFPSRYEDVRTIAYDTEHFSSRRIIVREVRAAHPGAGLLLRRWSKAKTR
jgi:hypothetical protein